MKSALIVWGGWDGHELQQGAELFAAFLAAQRYQVAVLDTLDAYLDEAKMQALDLIVPIWTIGSITPEQERGLLSAVSSGVGLAGWHGCMADSFRNHPEYHFMVGGQWVAHPGGIIDYTVTMTRPDDPIVARSPGFSNAF